MGFEERDECNVLVLLGGAWSNDGAGGVRMCWYYNISFENASYLPERVGTNWRIKGNETLGAIGADCGEVRIVERPRGRGLQRKHREFNL